MDSQCLLQRMNLLTLQCENGLQRLNILSWVIPELPGSERGRKPGMAPEILSYFLYFSNVGAWI